MNDDAGHSLLAALWRGEVPPVADAQALAEATGWIESHRLGPVVFEALPEAHPLCETLRPARQQALAAHLLRQAWLEPILREARERGLRLVGFKGWGLALLSGVYPAPDCRPLGDLDLWVPREHLEAAVSVFEAHDFRLKRDDPAIRDYYFNASYEVPLVHPRHGLVELHYAYHRDLPDATAARMLARAAPRAAFGTEIDVFAPPDLLLLLVQHFAIQVGERPWLWLEDLRRLGAALSENEAAAYVRETETAGHALFACASWSALEKLWGLRADFWTPDAENQLRAHLSVLENSALGTWLAELPGGRPSGDRLALARRRSGRPVRADASRWNSLWCHPGVVCLERNVRSDAPGFWKHRLGHFAGRCTRLWRAL